LSVLRPDPVTHVTDRSGGVFLRRADQDQAAAADCTTIERLAEMPVQHRVLVGTFPGRLTLGTVVMLHDTVPAVGIGTIAG
jgi:hypothetical protein